MDNKDMAKQYADAYNYIADNLNEYYELGQEGTIESIIINSSKPYSKSSSQNRLFFMIYEAVREGKPILVPSKMGNISIKIFDYSKRFLKRRVAKKYASETFFSKGIDAKLEDRMKDINCYIDELYLFRTDKEYHLEIMKKFYDVIMPEFKFNINSFFGGKGDFE